MGRYVSNAKSILNNGPVFRCVIWNTKTNSSVTIDAMIDTGGLFTTIDVDLAIELVFGKWRFISPSSYSLHQFKHAPSSDASFEHGLSRGVSPISAN